MPLIVALICLCSGSVFSAAFLKKKAEESLPLTMMLIILVLYVFYIVDALLIGFFVVVGLCIAAYVGVLIKLIKERFHKNAFTILARNLVTPAMVMFIVLCVVVYFITRNQIVTLWDALRVWGAYPKILYHTDAFQIASDTFYFPWYHSYPPGMPLLVYFFEKFRPVFSEPLIFFVYALFFVSMVMPALSKLTWKRAWMGIPMIPVILFIPLMFYNSYFDLGDFYRSLYIDPILALLFGFCIYLACIDGFKDVFSTVRFCASLCALVLIKETGTLFAAMSLVLGIILHLTVYRHNERKLRYGFIKAGVAVLAVLVTYFSWQLVLKWHQVENLSSWVDTSKFLVHTKNFFKAILQRTVLKTNFNMEISFFEAFIILFMITSCIIFFSTKEKRKPLLITTGILYLTNIIFLLGQSVMYDGRLSSFERYTSTLLLADFFFIALIILNRIGEDGRLIDIRRNAGKPLLALALVALLIIAPVRAPKKYTSGEIPEARVIADRLEELITIEKTPQEPAEVFFFTDGIGRWNSGLHHRVYFILIDKNIRIKNFYDEMNFTDPQDNEDQIREKKNAWINTLITKNYDYVYIAREPALMATQYGELFSDGGQADSLYRIEKDKDTIRLTPVH